MPDLLRAPATAPALSDGSVEALKWAALAAMSADHLNAFL